MRFAKVVNDFHKLVFNNISQPLKFQLEIKMGAPDIQYRENEELLRYFVEICLFISCTAHYYDDKYLMNQKEKELVKANEMFFSNIISLVFCEESRKNKK